MSLPCPATVAGETTPKNQMNQCIKILLFCLVLLSWQDLGAQLLDQRVSVQYADASIADVLSGISRNYGTRFAYSSDFIPVSRRVSVDAHNEPLRRVLDRVFEDQSVQYAAINGQVVLKVDRNRKQEALGRIEKPKIRPVQTSPIYPQEVSKDEMAAIRRQRERWEQLAAIERRKMENIEGGVQALPPPPVPVMNELPADDPVRRLAQISLLPMIGTNALRSALITNDLSLNILWGISGGVSGVEVGGFGNTVLGDVTGVQVAGVGSIVGGDVTGTQVGGLFNICSGRVTGVQAGGVFNISDEAEAVQAAGLFNISRGNMSGVQASGLFNIAHKDAKGVQAGSLFNVSGGYTHFQSSLLFNSAKGDVRDGQMSLFFNRAQRVEGFQFGLVNVADTIVGMPVGLFNFIRKGYNRVEISASESLYGNIAIKFGAPAFYNIILGGARWESGNPAETAWGVGYGLGSVKKLGPKVLINTELTAMHIHEDGQWTRPLNLLNRLHLSLDVRTKGHLSFFAGPTLNFMISKRLDPDTGLPGSNLPPHTIWEGNAGKSRAQAWIGFTAGIRV